MIPVICDVKVLKVLTLSVIDRFSSPRIYHNILGYSLSAEVGEITP